MADRSESAPRPGRQAARTMAAREIQALINHASITLEDYPLVSDHYHRCLKHIEDGELGHEERNLQVLALTAAACHAALIETRALVNQMLNPRTQESLN